MGDYSDRSYLSAREAASLLGISVRDLHRLVKDRRLAAHLAASGQQRFRIEDLRSHATQTRSASPADPVAGPGAGAGPRIRDLRVGKTRQRVILDTASAMGDLPDGSVHLMVTSPPYFDAKMYSGAPIADDLGNIHDEEGWFDAISRVWAEVFRVLQPGRKAFVNIMNLPVREAGSFRSLNLVGRTIDRCTRLGFIFKRDIVWQKTNGVRAHFGTYPYPGSILLNTMHEFILEFEKPAPKGYPKYAHVSTGERERSKLGKEFWLKLKNSDVWLMNPELSGDGRSHAAPFPSELPERLIRAYSFEGETVLDPFLGSGTTLRVAARWGRNGVGYEVNPAIAADAVAAFRQSLLDDGTS